jgi:hypothetical protein
MIEKQRTTGIQILEFSRVRLESERLGPGTVTWQKVIRGAGQ